MEPYEPQLSLLTALAVGLLVGLEREQVRQEAGVQHTLGGIRTYPIFALLGALSTMLEGALPWLPVVTFLGLISLLSIAYAGDIRKGADLGLTTEVAALLTFLLGALATSSGAVEPMSERLLLVAGLGVILTLLLSVRQRLHGLVQKISRDDLFSTLKFLILAAIVLPMLPNEDMGPFDALNPFSVGLMVVLISGLSFLGFVAMKLFGERRGVLLSAAVGGLASSTAVTIAFSNRTKENPELAPVAAAAIAIASVIMIARVGVLVSIINPGLLRLMMWPLVGAGVGALLGGLVGYHGQKDLDGDSIKIKNPFELGNAVKFGIAYAAVSVATKAARQYVGAQGLFLVAAVAGLTDVDAVTLSTARQAETADVAAVVAILIAVVANTIVKSSIALWIGGRRLGKRAFLVGALIVVGGAIGLIPDF